MSKTNETLKGKYIEQLLSASFVKEFLLHVVEIRMKSAAAGKTRFFDPPHMIFAA